MKHILTASLIILCACSSSPKEETAITPHDVLVIYSSGTPYKTISEVEKDKIDGITGTTPLEYNCKRIAMNMVSELREKKIDAVLVHASEIRDYKQILQAKAIVIGSPSRFWNTSWEVKKLFDDVFEKIYVAHKPEFKKVHVFSYAMAEYRGSAELTLQMIGHAVHDCGNKVDSSMVFVTSKPIPEYQAQCSNMADAIVKTLTE